MRQPCANCGQDIELMGFHRTWMHSRPQKPAAYGGCGKAITTADKAAALNTIAEAARRFRERVNA